jgi:hypothetical protein
MINKIKLTKKRISEQKFVLIPVKNKEDTVPILNPIIKYKHDFVERAPIPSNGIIILIQILDD